MLAVVDKPSLISQVWNAIVISMYREHLLSIDHAHRLIYEEIPYGMDGATTIRTPSFFLLNDDNKHADCEFFVRDSEAERRISFFAQSLSTSIPESVPIEAMPSFTVLIPHYSEKIILSLREIIKEDAHSKMSLLEYLKQIFPHEWKFFVADTKILTNESSEIDDDKQENYMQSAIDDLPLYCVGYKSSAPEYSLRTRIWASLRTQTLYRTVSGMMNYQRAIKTLHRIENPEVLDLHGDGYAVDDYLTFFGN
ncbi:unnamed protein product [Ambrosiozyma monospora]|uniref:Unnamed protein product n=1 Tax=Ambrosiozyma monospora TaxID=43982 RepID=A0A9W6T1E1_AMBMO|nr:unnamed protein product [Ambrosiozyma monospora]